VPRVRFFLLLLLICVLLRAFWWPFVWADEGLWFTVAQELLRGKALYRDIWFDKPPGLAILYAALFAPGVAPLAVVRLFAMLYSFAIAVFLWHMGRTLWSEKEGRWAALLYAFHNASYFPAQMQPLAADHALLLPYLAAGFLYLRGRGTMSGLAASLAFQLNPKALALFLLALGVEALEPRGRRLLAFAAGFGAGTVPWIAWLVAGDMWSGYREQFWGWGLRYASVYGLGESALRGLRQTLAWGGFHLPLILGGALLFYCRPEAPDLDRKRASHALLIWLAVSFLGVASGGRFFARYYFQILPLACLLAARGWQLYRAARGPSWWRYAALAGLLLATVRFHTRTAVLVYEAVTGRQTRYMAEWPDTALDRESRAIAARIGRGRSLFVWGYRPEIYFYCQCPPASSFLSSQPLTGVPADVHLRQSQAVVLEEPVRNRGLLVYQLRSTRPEFIVDGLGPYNPNLRMDSFPELEIVLRDYQRDGWIYRHR
jgi:hypothetical protein